MKRFLSTFVGKVILFLIVLVAIRMISPNKPLQPTLKQEPLTEKEPITASVTDKETKLEDDLPDPAVATNPIVNEPKEQAESPKTVETNKSDKTIKPDKSVVVEVPITSRLVLTDQESALLSNFDPKDFKRMGETLRLFKRVHDFVWTRPASRVVATQKEAVKVLEKLESMMFSWIKPAFQTTVELRASFKGKGQGIVLCAGNGHMITALPTLRMIRELHGFDIPFEIFYTGDNDLNEANRKRFEKIGNTVTRDITQIFDNEILKLGGWAVKAFALLASSFAESMLIEF